MDDVDFPDPEPATFSTQRNKRKKPEKQKNSIGNHGNNGNHHGNRDGSSPSDCDPLDIEPSVHSNAQSSRNMNIESWAHYSNENDEGTSALADSHRTMVGVNRDYASDVVISLPRQTSVPDYYASRESEENAKCVASSVLFLTIVVAVIVYMFVFNPEM